jgi:hypothetical protein
MNKISKKTLKNEKKSKNNSQNGKIFYKKSILSNLNTIIFTLHRTYFQTAGDLRNPFSPMSKPRA